MKPAPFDYVAPASIDAACAALADAGGGAMLMAGGQTLMPLLNLRMSQPFVIVDLGRIAALKEVSRSAGKIRIGAMLRQNEIIAHAVLQQRLPVLVEAARHIGHHQTRNRGTIGGSVALGEPAAELPATAVALDAVIEVQSTAGQRQIAAADFYLGPYMTSLQPDELITAIHFPEWPETHIPLFRELAQRPGDFALVGIVGALVIDAGKISRAGLAWFGMGPTPVKAVRAEQMLLGQAPDAIDVQAVADAAIADTAPFDDQHTSAEYRRTVGRRLFANLLRDALKAGEIA